MKNRVFTKSYSGNSLIVAIFLTTIFIMLSFGINSLILQSSANMISVQTARESFYGAESGVELALLDMKKHAPGYEATKEFKEGNVTLQYTIKGLTENIPHLSTSGGILQENQTKTFALFKDTGIDTAVITDMKDVNAFFTLTFQSQAETKDCLKWSIFGFTDFYKTESIGGYVSCSPVPSSLGNQTAFILNGQFKNQSGQFFPQYSIDAFLAEHKQNYLSIANIAHNVEPLTYSLSFGGEKMADENFTITSSATVKNFVQTEEVIIPQGEVSPAFYFSLVNPN